MSKGKLIVGWKAIVNYVGGEGGRSKEQIRRDIRAGRFPPPIELGPNSVAWIAEEVDAHIAALPRRTYSAPMPTAPEPQAA